MPHIQTKNSIGLLGGIIDSLAMRTPTDSIYNMASN